MLRFFIIIFTLIFGILLTLIIIGYRQDAPAYHGPKTDHFDGTHFHNLLITPKKSFWSVMKWQWTRQNPHWPQWVDNPPEPPPPPRINTPDKLSITFINHASVLIQIDGTNIITDPIWSERASPFSFLGPKRVRAPGLSLAQCPKIDVVLISHNHYDHLDIASLKALQKRFDPLFITGLGNDLLLKKHGINRVLALDWWQHATVANHPIYFVPAQHFSGRGLGDRMKTLWGGFVIKSSAGPIYFAGDTAWGPHFKQIEQHFGPIFTAFLPIGAYAPRDFMRDSHIDPAQAVDALEVLRAKHGIGIHFDTFARLADEPFGQAEKRLQKALTAKHLAANRFMALKFGQSIQLSNTPLNTDKNAHSNEKH